MPITAVLTVPLVPNSQIEEAEVNLQGYAHLAISQGAKCWSCQAPLHEENIECHGPHDRGWQVEGFPDKQWLYFVCPKCSYQTSLAKLGIERPVPSTAPAETPSDASAVVEDAGTVAILAGLLGGNPPADQPEPSAPFDGFTGGEGTGSGGGGGSGSWEDDVSDDHSSDADGGIGGGGDS